VWGIVLGLVARRAVAERRTFIVIAGLVVSHWVLDVIAHRPDVPLYPNGPKLGLGLWNSLPGTLAPQTVVYGYYDAAAKPALRVASGDIIDVDTLLTSVPDRLERAGVPPDQIETSLRRIVAEVTDRGPTSIAGDVAITQLVDGKVGVHVKMPKRIFTR
jgi:hypothetical protein